MEEMLRTLISLGYIKGWYPDQEEPIRNVQEVLISKLIPLGVQYTMENGEAVIQYGGFAFSLERSAAKKYMDNAWYTYVFGPEPVIETKPDEIRPNKGTDSFIENFGMGHPAEPEMRPMEEQVQEQTAPEPVNMKKSMKKDEFTYTAVVFSHIGDGRVTNVKVMAAPIDDEKTLFWFNNGTGDFIEVGEGGVGIPILDKTCKIVRRPGTDKFRIDIQPEEGCKVEPRFGSGGEGGHITFVLERAKVHVIPKNYKKNKDGSAFLIYCIETDDGNVFTTKDNVFEIYGQEFEVRSMWDEDRVLTVNMFNR